VKLSFPRRLGLAHRSPRRAEGRRPAGRRPAWDQPSSGSPRACANHPAAIRRRRLIAAGVTLVLVVGVAIAVFEESGGRGPRYVPSGSPALSVIAPADLSHAARGAGRAPQFKPATAAVSLAATLPLARQVAQLFMVSLDGRSPSAGLAIGPDGWGGVVLVASSFAGDSQAGALVAGVDAAARGAGGVPPLIAAAQAGGSDAALPGPPPQAEPLVRASGQAALARAQALATGQRLRALGFNMTLAPLADVDTPGGAFSGRLFGTDPGTVARLSLAAVNGYAAGGLISAVGHFPGSGGASADPDQMTATVGGSLEELRAHDLVPFVAVAPKAPVILMSNASYAAFDGVTPAGLLAPAVALLRNDYAFQGVVMSDDLDAALLATGGNSGSAAVQAIEAGDDLLYISGPESEHQAAYAAVLSAARASASLRTKVHDALLRVLSLKAKYGILR